MTTRHLGVALFALCLVVIVYVPACEYDPNGGKPAQPTYGDVLPSPDADVSAEVLV